MSKRHSNIGMWGQKMFTNGHNFEQQEQVAMEKDDVKQFLTDMHSEIKTMTNNLHNEVTTDTRYVMIYYRTINKSIV